MRPSPVGAGTKVDVKPEDRQDSTPTELDPGPRRQENGSFLPAAYEIEQNGFKMIRIDR